MTEESKVKWIELKEGRKKVTEGSEVKEVKERPKESKEGSEMK